jgi:hypothetical protein
MIVMAPTAPRVPQPVIVVHVKTREAVAVAGVLAAAAIGIGSYLVLAGHGSPIIHPSASAAPSPSPSASKKPSTRRRNPLTGIGPGGHVLAVKIDNVGVAQDEQAGLNSADLVYVIQVEGGLSRYLAIFDSSDAPKEVGPVRSARQTDIPLLAAYGRIGLAYSGAIPGLLPELAVANLRNITPDTAPDQFTNGGSSPTYINPRKIFAAYRHLPLTKYVGFNFGAIPAGGRPDKSFSVDMPAAAFTFTAKGTKWLVSVDGSPSITVNQGRTTTDNIIVQYVHVVPGQFTDHNAAQPANEVFSETTGSGTAYFYRDGKVWHGRWSKPTDTSATAYTIKGRPMELAPGRTWIILEG